MNEMWFKLSKRRRGKRLWESDISGNDHENYQLTFVYTDTDRFLLANKQAQKIRKREEKGEKSEERENQLPIANTQRLDKFFFLYKQPLVI